MKITILQGDGKEFYDVEEVDEKISLLEKNLKERIVALEAFHGITHPTDPDDGGGTDPGGGEEPTEPGDDNLWEVEVVLAPPRSKIAFWHKDEPGHGTQNAGLVQYITDFDKHIANNWWDTWVAQISKPYPFEVWISSEAGNKEWVEPGEKVPTALDDYLGIISPPPGPNAARFGIWWMGSDRSIEFLFNNPGPGNYYRIKIKKVE